MSSETLILYELANPSDPYTFYAPNVEVAGAAAVLLSTGFGAIPASGEGESSPVLFGWEQWLEEKGMDEGWFSSHASEIADALDSFLIGDKNRREDIESMLAELPEEKREKWRAERQDRHRSSMNKIGERAYELAKQVRAKLAATEE